MHTDTISGISNCTVQHGGDDSSWLSIVLTPHDAPELEELSEPWVQVQRQLPPSIAPALGFCSPPTGAASGPADLCLGEVPSSAVLCPSHPYGTHPLFFFPLPLLKIPLRVQLQAPARCENVESTIFSPASHPSTPSDWSPPLKTPLADLSCHPQDYRE